MQVKSRSQQRAGRRGIPDADEVVKSSRTLDTRKKALTDPRVTASVLEWVVENDNRVRVRRKVIQHPNVPARLLEKLVFEEKDRQLRLEIVPRIRNASVLKRLFFEEQDERIRAHAVQNPTIDLNDPEIEQRLVVESEVLIRAACRNKCLPMRLRMRFLERVGMKSLTYTKLMATEEFSRDDLVALVGHPSAIVRHAVVRKKNVDGEIMERLLFAEGMTVCYEEILEKRQTTEETIRKAAGSCNKRLVFAVAHSERAPSDCLREIYGRERKKAISQAVAANRSTPPDLLVDILTKGQKLERILAVKNGSTPREALLEILRQPEGQDPDVLFHCYHTSPASIPKELREAFKQAKLPLKKRIAEITELRERKSVSGVWDEEKGWVPNPDYDPYYEYFLQKSQIFFF